MGAHADAAGPAIALRVWPWKSIGGEWRQHEKKNVDQASREFVRGGLRGAVVMRCRPQPGCRRPWWWQRGGVGAGWAPSTAADGAPGIHCAGCVANSLSGPISALPWLWSRPGPQPARPLCYPRVAGLMRPAGGFVEAPGGRKTGGAWSLVENISGGGPYPIATARLPGAQRRPRGGLAAPPG